MTFELTENTENARRRTNLQPQLTLKIEGVDRVFGAVKIYKYIRIGDPDLLIGSILGAPWYIGGFSLLEDQGDYISFDRGTTAKIDQKLNPSRGQGTSVTRMTVSLIDKNEEISELISPGFVVTDLLGRKALVSIGFLDTAYPEDYVPVFRGQITDIDSGAGYISFGLASPEEKKRTGLLRERSTKLTADVPASGPVSTLSVVDASSFPVPVNGPSGSPDSSIAFYVHIDEELFSYTGKTATTLTGVTRAQLGTTEAAHDTDTEVNSFFTLAGNGIQLAQKLMQSGVNGYFATGVAVESFNFVSPVENIPNAIFFEGIDLEREYGLTPGDYVTVSGSSGGLNDFTLKQIDEIFKTNDGTYAVILGVSLVDETMSGAVASFRSQWDTLGFGAGMTPNDVDNMEHDRLYSLFLSSFPYEFRLREIANIKDFIDEQIYLPMTCYSVPRKGRSSVAYHIGPIPGATVVTLDQRTIINADKLVLRRSTNDNFNNTVRVHLDAQTLESEFDTIVEYSDSQSKIDIPVGDKEFEIQAQGLRSALQGESKANQAAERLLNRYAYGAEFFRGVQIHFGDAFNLEIADLVVVDTDKLNVTDTGEGNRSGRQRFFEIANKSLDVKKGSVVVDLVDTAFGTEDRYALISPASFIKSATSAQEFIVKESFASVHKQNEGRKWEDLVGASVYVRSADYSVVSSEAVITEVRGNTIFLDVPLDTLPLPDYIMELGDYNNQNDYVKLLFGFMYDGLTFDDGEPQYLML